MVRRRDMPQRVETMPHETADQLKRVVVDGLMALEGRDGTVPVEWITRLVFMILRANVGLAAVAPSLAQCAGRKIVSVDIEPHGNWASPRVANGAESDLSCTDDEVARSAAQSARGGSRTRRDLNAFPVSHEEVPCTQDHNGLVPKDVCRDESVGPCRAGLAHRQGDGETVRLREGATSIGQNPTHHVFWVLVLPHVGAEPVDIRKRLERVLLIARPLHPRREAIDGRTAIHASKLLVTKPIDSCVWARPRTQLFVCQPVRIGTSDARIVEHPAPIPERAGPGRDERQARVAPVDLLVEPARAVHGHQRPAPELALPVRKVAPRAELAPPEPREPAAELGLVLRLVAPQVLRLGRGRMVGGPVGRIPRPTVSPGTAIEGGRLSARREADAHVEVERGGGRRYPPCEGVGARRRVPLDRRPPGLN
mmetsp:Transcript_33541/g.80242  ORF Transcript_33541/g.80242 Transcript_33541/m.80242 type:complete len:424 (+) Transcript_33541:1315-2586(+)